MTRAYPSGPDPSLVAAPTPLLGLETVRAAVEAATGPAGLAVVLLYSFLVATVLPLPIQVVLVAPLELGVPFPVRLGVIVVVSATGTTVGSLCGFRFGHEIKAKALELWVPLRAYIPGPITAVTERVSGGGGTRIGDWTEARARSGMKRFGYFGLFGALCIPMFPHKSSVYLSSFLDDDYWRFALAVYAGSVGRLVVSLALAGGAIAAVN